MRSGLMRRRRSRSRLYRPSPRLNRTLHEVLDLAAGGVVGVDAAMDHHGLLSGRGREVAFVAHGHHRVAQAEGEGGLRGARQEGADAHVSSHRGAGERLQRNRRHESFAHLKGASWWSILYWQLVVGYERCEPRRSDVRFSARRFRCRLPTVFPKRSSPPGSTIC